MPSAIRATWERSSAPRRAPVLTPLLTHTARHAHAPHLGFPSPPGAQSAVLLPGCADAWNQKALRAGMGAQLRMHTQTADSWSDASDSLARWGCTPVAADARAEQAHYELDWAALGRCAVVVGSEAHGLFDDVLADPSATRCRIPLASGVESLNAAAAGSILLYEAARARFHRG